MCNIWRQTKAKGKANGDDGGSNKRRKTVDNQDTANNLTHLFKGDSSETQKQHKWLNCNIR